MPQLEGWQQTTASALQLTDRLQNPDDQDAWVEVDSRYGPVIQKIAMQLGLNADWACEARQRALVAFADAVRKGHFPSQASLSNPTGGSRTRAYLYQIARNKACDLLRELRRGPRTVSIEDADGDFFAQLPARDELQARWDREWRLAVKRQCLREARQHFSAVTYRVYRLRVIRGIPAAQVARQTGKSVEAVNTATSRVRSFLREIFPRMEEAF